jgi:acyl-CoA thioester hydrolase
MAEATAGPPGDTAAGPPSGWVDRAAGEHVFPLRVYYEDTDAAGIVYYVNYLKFAERARTEMLRMAGRGQDKMWREEGVGFAVRNARIDYHRPARLDDALEVRTRVVDVGGASLRLGQRLLREGALLADMSFRLAVIDRDGRPARLPRDIRDALQPHAEGESTP